jgi:hypothetical protein
MLTSSAVDCGFDPGSGQTKDNEIGIYCFFAELHPNLVTSRSKGILEI